MLAESPWRHRKQSLQSPLAAAVSAARAAEQRSKVVAQTSSSVAQTTSSSSSSRRGSLPQGRDGVVPGGYEAARSQWALGRDRRAEAAEKRQAVAVAFGRCFGAASSTEDTDERRPRTSRLREDELLERVIEARGGLALKHRLRCDAALTKLAEAWARAAAASRASVAAVSTSRTATLLLETITKEEEPATINAEDQTTRAEVRARRVFDRYSLTAAGFYDDRRAPVSSFGDMIEELGEGFQGDALREAKRAIATEGTTFFTRDAFVRWYASLVDGDEQDDDESSDDAEDEERRNALAAFDRVMRSQGGELTLPAADFPRLLEALGTTYCEDEHPKYLRHVLDPYGQIDPDFFADWYSKWVTAEDDDDEEEEEQPPEEERHLAATWASLSKPKPGQWKCSSCSVVNDQRNAKCVACETPNPQREPSSGFSLSPQKTPSTDAAPSLSGFSFMPSSDAAPSSSGFTFTQKPSNDVASSGFTFTHNPSSDAASSSSAGFSFMQKPSSDAAPSSGFTFTQKPSEDQAAPPSSSSGFTFTQKPLNEGAPGFTFAPATIATKGDEAKDEAKGGGFTFAPATIATPPLAAPPRLSLNEGKAQAPAQAQAQAQAPEEPKGGFTFKGSSLQSSPLGSDVSTSPGTPTLSPRFQEDSFRRGGAAFDEVDAAGSGVISADKLVDVLDLLGEGFYGDEMEAQRKLADPSGSGEICKAAFLAYYAKLVAKDDSLDGYSDDEEVLEEERESAREAWDALDVAGTGKLDASHFKALIESFGTVYCDEEHEKTLKKLGNPVDREDFVEWYAHWVCGLDEDDDDDDEKAEAPATEDALAARWAALSKPKPGHWKCASCSVVNDAAAAKCLACETPKNDDDDDVADVARTRQKSTRLQRQREDDDDDDGRKAAASFGAPRVTTEQEGGPLGGLTFGGPPPARNAPTFAFSSEAPPSSSSDAAPTGFTFGLPSVVERSESPMTQPPPKEKSFKFGNGAKALEATPFTVEPPKAAAFQFENTGRPAFTFGGAPRSR